MDTRIIEIHNSSQFREKLEVVRLETQPTIFHLLPGKYYLSFNLPSFIKIKGSGISYTTIELLDSCTFDSDSCLEDLTLHYDNSSQVKELDSTLIQLLIINCISYGEQFENPDSLIYSNTVRLRNCHLNLYNLNAAYIFNVLVGNLELENVKITHQVWDNMLEDGYEEVEEINNLFTIGYLSKLYLCNCIIDYETINNNTFLVSGNMSEIQVRQSKINLKSKIDVSNIYLFYLISCQLDIDNSKLNNYVRGGKLFFWDSEIDLMLDNLISNLQIENNILKIKKIGEEKNTWKLANFISGFVWNEQKIIFENVLELEEEFQVRLVGGNYKDTELILNPEIYLLYSFYFSDVEMLESVEGDYDLEIPDNYIVRVHNLNYQNLNGSCLIHQMLDHKYKYDFSNSMLEVDNLKINSLSRLSLEHLFKVDKGYSLLDKKKVGSQSIDFTLGDSNLIGIYNFASGWNNICQGNYSLVMGNYNIANSSYGITIGNNLINNFNYCTVLGRYNTEEYDWNQKLFVIGNGDEKKRSDALVVYEGGEVKISKILEAKTITDGICHIEEGNITGLKNMELEENLFVNQNLIVEGGIEGFYTKYNSIPYQVMEISGEIITTWKLDLSNFKYPPNWGEIISIREQKSHYIGKLEEKENGLLFELEVICIETPNYPDIRFVLSKDDKYGEEGEIEGKFIDMISSYNWTKGKRMIEKDKFQFDYDFNNVDYYLYLSREMKPKNRNLWNRKIKCKQITGKFLVRLKGIKIF